MSILLALLLLALILFIWAAPAYVAAMYAQEKGYSYTGFLILGLATTWIVSGIAALILDDRRAGTIVCPYCAERILAAANVCRYCGGDVSEPDDESGEEPRPPYPSAPIPSSAENP